MSDRAPFSGVLVIIRTAIIKKWHNRNLKKLKALCAKTCSSNLILSRGSWHFNRLSDTLLSRLYMKCEGDGSSSVPCSSVLWAWLAWQSAQHLVHGKLKSYLGKPQDSLG